MSKLTGKEEAAYRKVVSRIREYKEMDPFIASLAIHSVDRTCFKIDWHRLAYSSEDNFLHDIQGCVANFNPKTEKLEDCFVPRFAVREVVNS